MNWPLIASGVLWFVTGFAATVWTLLAWSSRRHGWRAFWYGQLSAATILGAVVLAAVLINRPFDLPRGVTTLLLIPIMGIPAALQLGEWRQSRRVLVSQAERIVTEEPDRHRRSGD